MGPPRVTCGALNLPCRRSACAVDVRDTGWRNASICHVVMQEGSTAAAWKLERHFAEMLREQGDVSPGRKLGKLVAVGRRLCTRQRGAVMYQGKNPKKCIGWTRRCSELTA